MRSSFFLLAAALAVPALAAGCSSSSSSGPDFGTPPANTVFLANMTFTPATMTVKVGTTVTWIGKDNNAHTVTSGAPSCTPDGKFDSVNPAQGFTFTHTFDTVGTFPYFCEVHCSMGMVGTITVTN